MLRDSSRVLLLSLLATGAGPAVAAEATVTLNMQEVWRTGGAEDESSPGLVNDIVADGQGNVYLLDAQHSEIRVHSADGEHLRTIGREGEGPGEFRGAVSMFLDAAGNLGVLQAFPSKIVLLTPEGEPAGEYPLPPEPDDGFRVLFAAEPAGDSLALVYGINRPSSAGLTQTSVLALVGDGGSRETVLHRQESTLSVASAVVEESAWDTFRNRWTAFPDGRVLSAVSYGEYSIQVWNAAGEPAGVWSREYPPHARTEEDKSRLQRIYEGFTRQLPVPDLRFEIEDRFNPIRALEARDDGSLWVLTSRGANGLEPGVAGVFDRFDAEGGFLGQTVLKGEGDPLADRYFFAGGGMFVVPGYVEALMALPGGEERSGVQQVIRYRLE